MEFFDRKEWSRDKYGMRWIIKGKRKVTSANEFRERDGPCFQKDWKGGEEDERTRRNACSKMLPVAGVADWSRKKKEIKVGRDASQCRCTCTRCSLQILLPIPRLAFFFLRPPYLVFPDRMKRAFINSVVP